MTQHIEIHQIYYNEATRALVDPAFQPLDNTANERPDWYEYWPIRRFLLSTRLEEDGHYGFFSPKFRDKTQLSGSDVLAYAESARHADVITFSPYPELAAAFLNVFEFGERKHAGLINIAQAFVARAGLQVQIQRLVMDTRNTVYSNYFVARPPFWRRWLQICEVCFEICEGPASELRTLLTQETRHQTTSQMKVFLIERIASLILATSNEFTVIPYPPYAMQMKGIVAALPPELVALDALKIAWSATDDLTYLQVYRKAQRHYLSTVYGRS